MPRPEHTHEEIAASWELWQQFADPQGQDTREDFEAMSMDQRLYYLEAFGGGALQWDVPEGSD